jgi:hypothetical protein
MLNNTTTKPLNQNKMKQTAVEWLFKQISTSKYFYNLMEDINSRSTVAQSNIFEQAKEMEKQQIVDAWNNGFEENRPYVDHSEDYYNETFKQQSVTDDTL